MTSSGVVATAGENERVGGQAGAGVGMERRTEEGGKESGENHRAFVARVKESQD